MPSNYHEQSLMPNYEYFQKCKYRLSTNPANHSIYHFLYAISAYQNPIPRKDRLFMNFRCISIAMGKEATSNNRIAYICESHMVNSLINNFTVSNQINASISAVSKDCIITLYSGQRHGCTHLCILCYSIERFGAFLQIAFTSPGHSVTIVSATVRLAISPFS